MINNKQSSVEWLWSELRDKFSWETGEMYDSNKLVLVKILEQAKAMHKEEHGQTWDKSLDNLKARGMNEMRAYTDFDDYYKETFGG